MKMTEAKYTRRYVTGEYEFEEMTLTAQIENESGAEALVELKMEVEAAHSGQLDSEEEPVETPKAKEKKKNGTKSKARNTDDEDTNDESAEDEDSGDDGEGDQDDETPASQDDDDADDSSDDAEDAADEEDEEEKPASKKAAPAKKAAGKKGGSKKPQVYNRTIEQHKEIFSGVLKSVAPNWKKSEETKAKAKKVSEKMEGAEFLDASGEVVESFTAQVKKLMATKK